MKNLNLTTSMKITLGSIFCFLLICNILLMPIADDFDHYFMSLHGFQAAIDSYMGWNGRIGELILCVYIPKLNHYVFDVINSLVGMGFMFSFFILIFGRIPKSTLDSLTLILFVALTISFTAFGSVYLWESGALNYLWGYFFIVLSLLPYRIFWQRRYENVKPKRDKFAVLKALGMMIACIVAGWSSEQMGIITLILHVGFFIFARIKKVSLPLWYYAGIIGFLLGWLMLYFSPGTAHRASVDRFYNNGRYMGIGDILKLGVIGMTKRVFQAMDFQSYLFKVFALCVSVYFYVRIVKFPKIAWQKIIWILSLAIAMIIVFVLNYKEQKILTIGILIFLIYFVYRNYKKQVLDSSILSCVVLLFILYFLCVLSTMQVISLPGRAQYGSDLLLIGMIALFFRDMYVKMKIRKWIGPVLVVGSILLGGGGVILVYANYNYQYYQMVAYIEKQKAAGNEDIVVPYRMLPTPLYSWVGIGGWALPWPTDPKEWPNSTYAKVFEIKSLRVE